MGVDVMNRQHRRADAQLPTRKFTDEQLNELLGNVHNAAYRKAYTESFDIAYKKAMEDAFVMMMAIPANILSSEGYWEKTSSRKLPVFLKDCSELYDCYRKNIVNQGDLRNHLSQFVDVDEVIDVLFKK